MTTVQYQQHVEKEYQTMRNKSTKKRVADRILGVDWSLGLTARQVADLDLAYYQEHAHLKTWKALRLDYKDQGNIAAIQSIRSGRMAIIWKVAVVIGRASVEERITGCP
ncbi:hypothetical protein BGZ82_006239 [Podila clonocystis]|nr:hypothetical protein BGZ82_006239 [Podila clonocystis]